MNTAPNQWHVRLRLDPRFQLMHGSFVLSTMFDMAATGELTLDIAWEPRPELYALVADVTQGASGVMRRICWDIQDRSYWWSETALADCDLYFKRSYFAPDVERLPLERRNRVRPFGPVFVYGSRVARAHLALAWVQNGWNRGHRAVETFRRLMDYVRLPAITRFEGDVEERRQPRVLFQTRLWEDREVTGDPPAEEINAERVALVRALKDALGRQFTGGLVSTALARSRYPELLCPTDTKRVLYLATMRSSAVGIYTRGLHDSTAWKLGEYLAAGCAIVASGLRNELPVPLRPGSDFVTFADPQQGVEECRRLLSSEDEMESVRRASQEYYRTHARPDVQLRRSLEAAFEDRP